MPALPPRRPQFPRESGTLRHDGFPQIESKVLPDQWLPRYRARCGKFKPRETLESCQMKLRKIGIQRFLQVSSALVILGLLLEIASLLWFHPLSFVLFAFVAATLTGLGILVYLVALVFGATAPGENSNSEGERA